MPPNLSTSNRMYNLKLSEYEVDDLLIAEMSGHESVSQLFEFHLRLMSEHDDIAPRRIIGKPAILRIEGESMDYMGGERHWNGVVSGFQRTGRATSADGEDVFTYECDIVPWFWFMTQHEDCRIFQNKTVQEIVETIFGEFAYSDFRFDLTECHPPLEYCTQYHETTFDFISRLCEREGIHYYFRHNEAEETNHILFFTDNNGSNPELDPSTIPYHHAGTAEGGLDAIVSLSLDQQMRTRKVTLGDWDYMQKRLLRENTPTVLTIGEDRDLERYRYPGSYVDTDVGKYRTRVMMEAEEASHMRFLGTSQVRTLTPGHTFTLRHHPFEELNIKYMVLAVRHHGHNNLPGGSAADYGNEFTLQPHDVTFRAPLGTPRGQVRGPQTALVTGPAGEEIHTDEHGRIKIQFHWDRQGQYNDASSCWVRVAQVWAGNGYGTLFIPRIGMEVVVDFLEGDPDQPIVTGCVYNGVNRPPQPLPHHATRSGIKTLSSKGGGGTNELGFEDKKGHEEVFLQAEKNLSIKVKAARTESVGASRNTTIGSYDATKVRDYQSLTVEGDRLVRVKGYSLHLVNGDCEYGSDSSYLMLHSATTTTLAGTNRVDISSREVVVDGLSKISLQAGGSFITLGPEGVSISGALVKINSGGSPLSTGTVAFSMPDEDASGPHGTEDGTVTSPIQQLQAQALINAALAAQPFCAECEAARAAYEALMG